jgi:hypothetical protein
LLFVLRIQCEVLGGEVELPSAVDRVIIALIA